MYIFFVIWLMCVHSSPPLHLTKYGFVWYSWRPRNAQPHVTSLTPCNAILTKAKPNLHCTLATIQTFIWDHSKNLAATCAIRNNKFSLLTSRQKTQMSKVDVTVAWIEIYMALLLEAVYGTSRWQHTSSVTSRKDFTMQSCSAKRRKSKPFLYKHSG
jgi:hypothetical protein